MGEENHMNQGPAVSPQAGGEQNRRRQVTENLTPTQGVTGGEVLDDAQERLGTLKQDMDYYIRRNPAKAVFTALGIGFVLGLMRRRR